MSKSDEIDPSELGGMEALLREMSTRLGGVSPLVTRQLQSFSSVLNRICRMVNSNHDILIVKRGLKEMFDEPQALGNFRSSHEQMYNPFPLVYSTLAEHMHRVIGGFEKITKDYAALEDLGLEKILKGSTEKRQPLQMSSFPASLPILVQLALREYLSVKSNFPVILEGIYKSVIAYNHYLRKRFVKTEENKSPVQKFLIFDPDEEERVKYVKIELTEGNPVLTDLLLHLIEEIPIPHEERHYSRKEKGKKVKRVSKYAVEDAAEKLFNCADRFFLHYVGEPRAFFERMGEIAQSFYAFGSSLDKVCQELMHLPNTRLIGDAETDEETIERRLQIADRRARNGLAKLKRLDFEEIMQKRDEVQPDNRREIDYFKARGKLLDLLYSTLTELAESKIAKDTGYDSLREDTDFQESLLEKARETVMKAVELKAEMEEIATSNTLRQLRKDKSTDNEFYVGRQGEIGRFYFQRQPTPKVKMEEVIGASFDQAKDHLRDIIETGSYSRVMRLSAPGGKVRSNILLIGPFGCGKTELARAVCADERVIGASVSVASTLTAYMHESVNNVKRVYDAAKELRMEAREMKPVLLVLDEFDGWFAHSDYGNYSDLDMQQIENIMLEVLDGMEDYNGLITMAMTNKPKIIPKGIMRRFRYVDIVGELTAEERAGLLKMYLEKTLPIHESVPENYSRWAEKLADAPGDVVRKVVDELHFQKIPQYLRENKPRAERMERILYKREMNKGASDDKDIAYVRETLRKGGVIISPMDVDREIDQLLLQPAIRMQINAAREVYRDARRLLENLASGEGSKYGLKTKSHLFE